MKGYKKCSKCKKIKPKEHFYKSKKTKDGLNYWCDSCYKEYRYDNKDKRKLYLENNREKLVLYNKNRYKNNKTYFQNHWKKYYEKNKESLLKKDKIYKNNRLKIDINFRIRHNLRTALVRVLKGRNKYSSLILLLGCSIEYLKQHLQSKFYNREDGLQMSFDNYGKWHIDHIRPCASFDLSKPEEQARCFHYTNLQPLWKLDNLRKSDKITRGDQYGNI
jgi:hypothetical protein